MKEFKVSKKALLVALIAIGLFVYIFLIIEDKEKAKIEKEGILPPETNLPVSAVYRYDFENREYLPDEGKSWQKTDFVRYIYDLAPVGGELEKCFYFTYDNLNKKVGGGGERKCNTNLTVTLGEDKDCPSQGENACTLYVYATDKEGNQGEMTSLAYHIDWQRPQVGKVYQENGTFLADVSDNVEVNYCWLYINGKSIGSMKIEDSSASLDFSVETEPYTAFVRCADHYDGEKGEYLNLASGEMVGTAALANKSPQISSCRAIPSQGTKETEVHFTVEASDPEGGKLFFQWEFGDGSSSTEEAPSHFYQGVGTFEPKVIVSDGKGESVCFTAWVTISQE